MTLEARMFKAGSKAARESMTASHIPGMAVAGWLVWMVAAALVALWLGPLGVPDAWIGLQVVAFILAALVFLFAVKVADQWEKAVVLRFGRFAGLRGPGMFAILPVIERLPIWIDHRVMVTPFSGLSLDQPMGPEPRARQALGRAEGARFT